MKDDGYRLGRRELLSVVGALAAGCAHLPAAIEASRAHPCDAQFCRYYRPQSGGSALGTCSLATRAEGGA